MRTVALILMLLVSGVVSATGFEQRFTDASSLFHAEMYDSAAHQYETLINEGYYSPELFFNTGNCYYQSGNFILASYYFLKAKFLQPHNKTFQSNLALARSSLPADPSGYDLTDVPWLEMIVRTRSVNYWTWLALILLNTGFAGLLLLRFREKVPFRSFILSFSFSLIVAGFFAGIFSWYAVTTLSGDHLGMIITEQAGLYSAPSTTGTVTNSATGGSVVGIKENAGGWYLVENESVKGWIKKESLKLF